jgi:hypothetical protein
MMVKFLFGILLKSKVIYPQKREVISLTVPPNLKLAKDVNKEIFHLPRIINIKFFRKKYTGIPRFTLLMWGHIKRKTRKQKPCKARLLISTKGEKNRIEL